MIEERVANRDELTDTGRGSECRIDHLDLKDPRCFLHGRELELLFRAEVRVDAALAHLDRVGELADREPFETLDSRERNRFADDRSPGTDAIGSRFSRLRHVDKIARSFVLCA